MRPLLALLLVLHAGEAVAYPFLALRPGGTPFEGPADGEISSLFWNPAALGLMHGLHIGGVGTLLVERGSVDRAAICSATGLPGDCGSGASQAFPSAPLSGLSGSGMGGLAWDFRTENFTIAFGSFAPWETHRHFDGAGSPTAYHLRSEDFTTVYFALALAVRLARVFNVGASIGLADSWATMEFDRDAALEPYGCGASSAPGCTPQWPGGPATTSSAGFENPRFAERIRVHGSGGTSLGLPSPSGLSIGLGATYRVSERLVLGASWNRMFPIFNGRGRYGSGSAVGSTFTPPAAASGMPCGAAACSGGDLIDYDIPDVWALGARVLLARELELSSWVRLLTYGGYGPLGSSRESETAQRALVVHLSGAPVDQGGAPERIVFGIGLQPAVAGELGLRWRPLRALRLGLSFIAETSAIPSDRLSATAVEGPKLDGMLAAEWRAARYLRFLVGYELTGYLFTSHDSPHPGAFDPNATVQCVGAQYALASCTGSLAGLGLPTAAGAYSLLDHRVSFGVSFDLLQ